MKTLKTFFKHQLIQPCQNLSRVLFSPPSSWLQSLSTHVKTSLLSIAVRAKLATVATLSAASSNWPKYLGYALVAFAVLTEFVCRFFDPQGGDPLAYWNAYHFLFAIRSEISTILICTGGMMLMQRNMKEKWVFMVPAAYKFGRLIWLAFASTNKEYHQLMHWSFLLIGLSASVVWFVMFDYLMELHYHKRTRPIATTEGLLEGAKEGRIDKDFAIAQSLMEIVAYKNVNR